jgi:magnesium transporter
MIEILYTDDRIKVFSNLEDVVHETGVPRIVQLTKYTDAGLADFAQHYGLDISFLGSSDDIEISSHFLENGPQLTIHFSFPYVSGHSVLEEEQINLMIKHNTIFTISYRDIDEHFPQNLKAKYESQFNDSVKTENDFLEIMVASLADYFADLTEYISKRIKQIAVKAVGKQDFDKQDLDHITQLNFSNSLLKESLNEFRRIMIILRKHPISNPVLKERITSELNDLAVVAEYIQYNFDRLDDLKENINSKIDLEQNHIFKILTIITVCVSLPTLVAGVFGMNFENMPELKWRYGYVFAIGLMVCTFTIPLLIFKKKRWF